jgi:hypothetical protein
MVGRHQRHGAGRQCVEHVPHAVDHPQLGVVVGRTLVGNLVDPP